MTLAGGVSLEELVARSAPLEPRIAPGSNAPTAHPDSVKIRACLPIAGQVAARVPEPASSGPLATHAVIPIRSTAARSPLLEAVPVPRRQLPTIPPPPPHRSRADGAPTRPPPEPDLAEPRLTRTTILPAAPSPAHPRRPRHAARVGRLAAIAILVLSLGAVLCVRIEVAVKAVGVLSAPSGLRSVESVLAGAASEVLVRTGDAVEMGQLLLRLDDADLRSDLAVREQELATLRHETEQAARADRALLDEVLRAGDRKEAALEKRNRINHAQLEQRSARLADLRELVAYGAASQKEAWDADEAVQAALQQGALLDSQLIDLDLNMADRLREWEARELERRSILGRAQAAVADAQSALAAMEIRSPVAGRVESLLPKPGDTVQGGAIVASVVPRGARRRIVSFVPSREATQIALNSLASVEVESLPVAEFGRVQAHVERVASEVARADELSLVLGRAIPGSFVRVELELSADAAHAPIAPHLRSGERVSVHLHTREQRVYSTLFELARAGLAF